MKGLVLYELYVLKAAYMKNLLLVGALYAALTFVMRMEFFPYMMIWMMGFYAVGSMSLDQGWSRYAKALPVRARQLAGAKFASAGVMQLIGVVYALALGGAMCLANGGSFGFYVSVVLGVAMLSLIATSVLLPCALKWGVEKARNTLMLVFLAFFGGGVLLAQRMDLSGLDVWLEGHWALLLAIMALIAVLVCGTSWLAMVRVYERKEF